MRVFVGAEDSPITLVLDKRHRSYNLPTGKTKPIVQAWILSNKLNRQRFVFFLPHKKSETVTFSNEKTNTGNVTNYINKFKYMEW